MSAQLEDIVRFNDERAWLELYGMAQACLRTAARGGKKGRAKADRACRDRMNQWLKGDREAMWDDPRRKLTEAEPRQEEGIEEEEEEVLKGTKPEEKHQRAAELARDGMLGRACAALISAPPVKVTPRVIEEMRRKHPAARPEDALQAEGLRKVSGGAATKIGDEAMRTAVHSFPKGSGPGASGLRPQHIKDALTPAWGDEILRQLRKVGDLMAEGKMPREARPWFCGANLQALPKKDNSLRPVASGETLRRLIGKAVWEPIKAEVQSNLEPIQLGVGTAMGAERIVHLTRAWLNANKEGKGRVLVTLDLSNAFNCVDRWAFREAVRDMAPSVTPWVETCYEEPSYLVLGTEVLRSERGIQQGDPLGPGLFGMAIQKAVLEAATATRERFGEDALDHMYFFLDDGVAGGTAEAIQHWLLQIETGLGTLGLDLQRHKCVVTPAAGTQAQRGLGLMFPGMDYRVMGDGPGGGFELLGAPFGGRQ